MMKDKKRETFIFNGLGFPIKLIRAPLKKMAGEWVLDVDFDKLELAVLRSLLEKQAPLSGNELKFIRKYLNMTTIDRDLYSSNVFLTSSFCQGLG